MKYLGWVDNEGEFYPTTKARSISEWKQMIGYLEQHEDGRILFWSYQKLMPSTYPDLDTALVAIKLKMS